MQHWVVSRIMGLDLYQQTSAKNTSVIPKQIINSDNAHPNHYLFSIGQKIQKFENMHHVCKNIFFALSLKTLGGRE